MRTITAFFTTALALIVLAGSAHAQATASQAVSLLGRYPNGGDGLVTSMESLLASSPASACGIVRAASSGNRAQKSAVADALARARRLLAASSSAGAEQLESAAACGDSEFQTAYASAKAIVTTSAGLLVPRVTGGEYGVGVVSRSRP